MAKLQDLPQHLLEYLPFGTPALKENRSSGITRGELRLYQQQLAAERPQFLEQNLEANIEHFRFKNGHSLLTWALAQAEPNLELIENLIKLGTSVTAQVQGKTPLHYLCDRQTHPPVVTHHINNAGLLTCPAPPDEIFYEVAGTASRLAALKWLIQAGASWAAPDDDGLRALDYCLEDILFPEFVAYRLKSLDDTNYTWHYFFDDFFEQIAENLYQNQTDHPMHERVHSENFPLWHKLLELGQKRADKQLKHRSPPKCSPSSRRLGDNFGFTVQLENPPLTQRPTLRPAPRSLKRNS